MANNQPKDLLSRVADLSEEALQKLPNVPGGDRVAELVNQSRARLDEMQKKLRGIDTLEKRVGDLEKRLAKLEKPSTPRTSARKQSAPKKPDAPTDPEPPKDTEPPKDPEPPAA